MIKIRKGVFETNSSSIHTLTVCSLDQYEAWRNGELIYDEYEEQLIPFNEMLHDEDDYRYQTYDYYYEDDEAAEPYVENVVTPGGESIVIFGRAGYEG